MSHDWLLQAQLTVRLIHNIFNLYNIFQRIHFTKIKSITWHGICIAYLKIEILKRSERLRSYFDNLSKVLTIHVSNSKPWKTDIQPSQKHKSMCVCKFGFEAKLYKSPSQIKNTSVHVSIAIIFRCFNNSFLLVISIEINSNSLYNYS